MEKLPQEQQESLRKASNDRLRVMAARIGSVSDEEIAVMDRAALLQVVAAGGTARAEGDKEVTPGAIARKPPGEVAVQLERRLELRKAELEAEDRKAERAVQLGMRQMEMEGKEKERQDRKEQMEFDFRVKELEMQGERQRLEHEAQLALSERGSVAGVGGMCAECREDVDDSG